MSRADQLTLPLDGPESSASGGGRGKRRPPAGGPPAPPPPVPDTSLSEEAQRRYLNYALSVITSRALPDVRDGLKPVQRRILYAMHHDLGLAPDGRYRKSAAVVGDVMGKYHPHGDTAIYDAMVRLAQDFVMRGPLVAGHGNFGSIDGDAPAAMRYTEAKLRPLAVELLRELGKRTVEWRPNYDGTRSEPIVLPSRFPNLLVNGSQGIAVGMATSIPPHNLNEVIDACAALIDDPNITMSRLLSLVRGPDFPTGGQLLTTKKELEAIYEAGQGSLKLRGEWLIEDDGSKRNAINVVLTSIPYAVERRSIVEKIAEVIIGKKLSGLLDVRDESTTDVRVVLELKRGTDPQLVMAYLYKNTPLATNVQVNLTCLVPTDKDDVAAPRRLSLKEILREFVDFRLATVTRRVAFELEELRRRIHVLEGFEKVFDALDEMITIIRKSEGKADAASKLVKRFALSDEQVDAILELRLYRLARLEIQVVKKELSEKRAEAKRLDKLLGSESARWKLVQDELSEIKSTYGDRRRTKVVGAVDEPEFQAEDFIQAEDANVILTAQGWVKRVREIKDLSQTRVREGDSVLSVAIGSTRSTVAFFSNLGAAYVARIHDVPPSTGYGDPVQKFFKLADGEKMIALLSFDPRVRDVPDPTEGSAVPEPPFALALMRSGLGFVFSLRAHRDASTRAGRRFARLNEGDEVVAMLPVDLGDVVLMASSDGHALAVPVSDISQLSGVGKGSAVMKVPENERVVAVFVAPGGVGSMLVETEKGKLVELSVNKILGTRGDRGQAIVKRDRFAKAVLPAVALPSLSPEASS